MQQGPREVGVVGDVAESFSRFDPQSSGYSSFSAKRDRNIGDAVDCSESGANAQGNFSGCRAAIGERHAQKGSARVGRSAPGEGRVEAIDREMRAWNPVLDQLPRGVLKSEWLAGDAEVRLQNG